MVSTNVGDDGKSSFEPSESSDHALEQSWGVSDVPETDLRFVVLLK